MFLATFRPQTVLALVTTSCLATSLLAIDLRADPALALEDFNGFCLSLLNTQPTPEYGGVQRLDEDTTQQFIKMNNAREDTVLWDTRSSDFAIQTYESVHDFCFLFSFNSDLAAVKEAYPAWRQSLGETFAGRDDMHSHAERASAFLVKQFATGEVLQLVLNHDARVLNGLTTLAGIRLEQPSPAALEVLQEYERKREVKVDFLNVGVN